jgi:hypothetical protein
LGRADGTFRGKGSISLAGETRACSSLRGNWRVTPALALNRPVAGTPPPVIVDSLTTALDGQLRHRAVRSPFGIFLRMLV